MPRPPGSSKPSPARVIAFALALALAAGTRAQPALPALARPPAVTPAISREEAVVVSIRTFGPARGLALGEEEENLPADEMSGAREDDAEPETAREEGIGSGFVISADGYILTNAHVVVGADDILVRLADKRRFAGRVVGFDRVTDVALVKIDATALVAARLGDPARLQVGEWVVAIGAPFGLENSVTAGIVSARRRYMPGGGGTALIQTDVAISPGSSGSPLFNLAGEVIGMNSMMMTANGSYSGVSLALPIDTAMQVAGALRDHGHLVRSHIGAQLQEVTPELARSFGLAAPVGALVLRVQPGGPAAQADLHVGDIVVGVAEAVDSGYAELQQRLGSALPDRPLALRIGRRGAPLGVTLIPKALPAESAVGVALSPQGEPRLGLTFREPSADGSTGAAASNGLGVIGIRGAARRAGIHLGDTVLAVNDIRVESIGAFDAALAATPGDRPVALLILRRSSLSYIAVDASD
jgi:serine protease Do